MSVVERSLRGRVVAAKRRASSRSSFSVTAASMIAPRSPSGTCERMRARSRWSFSWSPALAVNCTLYRPGARGWTTGGEGGGSGLGGPEKEDASGERARGCAGLGVTVYPFRTELARLREYWTPPRKESPRRGCGGESRGPWFLRESPHQGRCVFPRRHFGDQLLDLSLGPMRCASEQSLPILCREVRCEQGDRAQVKAPVAEHRQEHRVLARGAGDGDAQVGLTLREMESLRAVGEHGRERFTGVEASLVRLGNVGDEVRLDAARLAEDLGQAAQEDVVGDRGERPALGFEGWSARGERGQSALVVHERRVRLVMDRVGPLRRLTRTKNHPRACARRVGKGAIERPDATAESFPRSALGLGAASQIAAASSNMQPPCHASSRERGRAGG